MKKNRITVLRVALGLAAWFFITMTFSKILAPRLPERIPNIVMLILGTMIVPYTVGLAGFFVVAGRMEKRCPQAEIPVTCALLLKSLIIQLGISIPIVAVINIVIRTLGGNIGNELSTALLGDNWLFYAVLLLLFNPIFEELLFRKIALERLMILGEKNSIIITSVLFSLPHVISQGIPQMFATFIVSLVWGYLRVKTGKIWPCMLLHCVFNLFCGYIVSLLSGIPAGSVAIMLIFMIFLPVVSVIILVKNGFIGQGKRSAA